VLEGDQQLYCCGTRLAWEDWPVAIHPGPSRQFREQVLAKVQPRSIIRGSPFAAPRYDSAEDAKLVLLGQPKQTASSAGRTQRPEVVAELRRLSALGDVAQRTPCCSLTK